MFFSTFIETNKPIVLHQQQQHQQRQQQFEQQRNGDKEHQSSYLQLLQQREEENRQEVAKLTAEIRSLKVQLIQLRSKLKFLILTLITLPLFHSFLLCAAINNISFVRLLVSYITHPSRPLLFQTFLVLLFLPQISQNTTYIQI